MKKAVFVLLIATLIFVAFVSGVYVGRNFWNNSVRPHVPSDPSTSSSSPTNDSTPDPTLSTSPTDPTVKTTEPLFPININTATVEQLDLLPDIGPVKAKAIVDYRAEFGPFTCVEDLLYVDGIGEKTLAKIKPYITV